MRKDLVHYPYAGVMKHRKMDALSRAAQFTPFSALNGYKESIDEASQMRWEFVEPGEDHMTVIDKQAQYLLAHIKERPEAEFTVFVKDEKRSGGQYKKIRGHVKTIDLVNRTFQLTDRSVIPMDLVVSIAVFDRCGS